MWYILEKWIGYRFGWSLLCFNVKCCNSFTPREFLTKKDVWDVWDPNISAAGSDGCAINIIFKPFSLFRYIFDIGCSYKFFTCHLVAYSVFMGRSGTFVIVRYGSLVVFPEFMEQQGSSCRHSKHAAHNHRTYRPGMLEPSTPKGEQIVLVVTLKSHTYVWHVSHATIIARSGPLARKWGLCGLYTPQAYPYLPEHKMEPDYISVESDSTPSSPPTFTPCGCSMYICLPCLV